VAQWAVGTAHFWVTEASSSRQRISPRAIGGTTSRTLHWRMDRMVDPFGHKWENGSPLGVWPPQENDPTQSQ